MSAFLPQYDPNSADRETSLKDARAKYAYSYTHVSPLAILDNVPFEDQFSFDWLTAMAEKVGIALENRGELEAQHDFKCFHIEKRVSLSNLLSTVESAVKGIKEIVTDFLQNLGRVGAESVSAKALDDFAKLFRTIGLPPVPKHGESDRVFSYMRIAGPNPVMIRAMDERDPRLPITDADFQVGAPGDSLDAALAEGRLLLVDYAVLDGAEQNNFPKGQKYLYAPLVLFVLDKATKDLKPVAIQCKQRPGPDNPIFTPADGYNWLIAKTIVEVADGNIHEPCTHLGQTHLFMEPFAMATYRQLALNHPLMLLLGPHFEGTFAINDAAWQHLIADKGAVDKLCSASIGAARGLAVKGVQDSRVSDIALPKSLKARGVMDRERLPVYPYRDDAYMYWNAIHDWVDAYLRLYYETPQDVTADTELQAWGRELASNDGGRIAGMPNDGTFHTVEEVRDVLTLVIFTCSVQHAAVNFPQYDIMSYVPNMPLASYRPAPTTKTGATEADFLAMFPPLDMAELQMELGYLLGTMHYTQLGQYAEGRFQDPRVAEPLAKFQQRIAEIGTVINMRNETRRPYTFLVPTGVPQSINV